MTRVRRLAPAFPALLALPLLAMAGCAPAAYVGMMLNNNVVKPSYAGFKGQSVGVMAWADDSLTFEHNQLILDVTHSVWQKLQGAQQRKAEELLNTTFPRDKDPDAMYAFQRNYPDTAAEPIADVAPRLGVSRLIYIEISNFDLHSGAVVDLARGNLSATVTVVEVANGKGKSAFRSVVEASYPEKSPQEGMPNLSEQQTYIGTIDRFSTEVVKKFVSYPDR